MEARHALACRLQILQCTDVKSGEVDEAYHRLDSLAGCRAAGVADRRDGAASIHDTNRERARRPEQRISDRRTSWRRRTHAGDGLPRRLELVRRALCRSARLGLWTLSHLRVPGRQRTALHLRTQPRHSDRHLCDRPVLGPLLLRPPMVWTARLLDRPSAAAALPAAWPAAGVHAAATAASPSAAGPATAGTAAAPEYGHAASVASASTAEHAAAAIAAARQCSAASWYKRCRRT